MRTIMIGDDVLVARLISSCFIEKKNQIMTLNRKRMRSFEQDIVKKSSERDCEKLNHDYEKGRYMYWLFPVDGDKKNGPVVQFEGNKITFGTTITMR